ncbi:hypothetical protein RYH73_11510 [Olivibacter sp. CPCC 100613]|uniref:hypothetical protein n=1 Tax=Olivibacter sp. CPCC 100613 TaxID=3079931 RepID=UPI002FF99D8D
MKFKSLFLKLWGIPIVLSIACTVGLLTALVGDDIWDVLSWLLLGSLPAIIVYYWIKSSNAFRRP